MAQLDGYANGVKPAAVEGFLRDHGHDVEVVNSYYLSRASGKRGSLRTTSCRIPSLRKLGVYLTEAASILTRRSGFGRRRLSYYLLLADYRLRGHFQLGAAARRLRPRHLRAPTGRRHADRQTSATTFYDYPDPYADELYDEGKLTEKQHRKLRALERDLFESVDGLSSRGSRTHATRWSTTRSADATSGSSTGAASRPPTVAVQQPAPRDLPGLALVPVHRPAAALPAEQALPAHRRLRGAAARPGPRPELLGWAAPTILSRVPVRLITTSKDELRRDGISAEHLDYIAYGLPVLVPAWRRHLDLLRGSIPYEEETFSSLIGAHSTEAAWTRGATRPTPRRSG